MRLSDRYLINTIVSR